MLQLQRDGFIIVKSFQTSELTSAFRSSQNRVIVLRQFSTIEHVMVMFRMVIGRVSAACETVICQFGMRRLNAKNLGTSPRRTIFEGKHSRSRPNGSNCASKESSRPGSSRKRIWILVGASEKSTTTQVSVHVVLDTLGSKIRVRRNSHYRYM